MKTTTGWEDSAETVLQVKGCEGKQCNFGWLNDIPCGDIANAAVNFRVAK